jgi:hypothetical protein
MLTWIHLKLSGGYYVLGVVHVQFVESVLEGQTEGSYLTIEIDFIDCGRI